MPNRCPFALCVALVCNCWFAARFAPAASELPSVGRPVHAPLADVDESLTPQMEPLKWEPLDFQPRWSGTVGAIFLQRSRPVSTPFVINPVSGDNIIDPANFRFPAVGGLDIGAIRYGTWADIEFRYFGINDWQSAQGPVFSPDGFGLPIPGFDPSNFPLTIASSYVSSLNSVEINLRRQVWSRWSLLAGFRYLAVDERLSFFVGDNTLQNGSILGFNANNDLFGLQIGGDGVLWAPGPRFRLETAVKAGVFANAARSSIGVNHIGSGGGGDPDVINWWGHDHTAFVGDVKLVGVYQMTPHWALRGGYQLLWLNGIAVASEQIHRLNLLDGDVGVNTSHGLFYHGALAGLEATW